MPDRRQQRDRRRWRMRRRDGKGDQRIFVLELTSSELHLVALEKKAADDAPDQVDAATYPWRAASPSLGSSEGAAELTAAFREIARQHAMHNAEVRIVLSGEFCVLRAIRGTIEEVRTELQQLEQRSRLYLSLGPGEKVLVSNTRSIDARHAQAMAAVCNQATLQTIEAASEAAGMKIVAIEPALASLNRAVARLAAPPQGSYLLVNLHPSGLEIGVCHEGQLLLDYRPGGRTSAVDLPSLLENHLTRLARHVARHLRAAPPELNQVLVCGDHAEAEAAARALRRQGGMIVRHVGAADVKATWQIAEADAASASPAALGSLLAAYLPAGSEDTPNLLQHIIDSKREPLRPKLIRSAAPLAATLLAAAVVGIFNGRLEQDLAAMQAELDSLVVAEARATELRLQLIGSKSKLTQLTALAAQLPGQIGGDAIQRLAHCMPSDVWLSKLEVFDRRAARLQGASYLEAGVYEFVRWLEQAPGFAEVALKSTRQTESASGPTTTFDVELNLAADDPATVAGLPASPVQVPPKPGEATSPGAGKLAAAP